MKAILIPVKQFHRAKTRLAKGYSESARAALAAALCEDFFLVVAAVKGAGRVFVVSAEPRALELARERGWETIVETEQISESHSVDAAARLCTAMGVTSLLRLPVDIPLAKPADIEEILSAVEPAPSAILVPSREGTGTNALLRSPPDLFPSNFGPNSFALHLAEAERCSARVRVIENPRIALDIDEDEDLTALIGLLDPASATAQWIAQYRP
jgi:2-phospho-L-lactate/phosphoenolpyruvate guanylyltransferase